MKTIFFTVTRGIILRNFIETGLIKKLAKKNINIILLFPHFRENAIVDQFKRIESKNVSIEIVPNKHRTKIEVLLNRFIFAKLVFSKSTKLYLRYHIKEKARVGKIHFLFLSLVYYPLSKVKWLKTFVRYIDNSLVADKTYENIFDKYKPDLIFSTSIISHFDVEIIKTAKRRGIKTISMPRSWDNLDKFLFRVIPDLLLVQNQAMKKEAEDFQNIKSNKIRVVGFPQFDIYSKKDIFLKKEEYCITKNFDNKLPILFLGSEGAWSEKDNLIFEDIIKARNINIPNCNILIRSHPSRVFEKNYDYLLNFKNVFIDKYGKDNFFVDNANFSQENTIDFANSLYHCGILITFASTLALDAVCFLKPVIAVAYGVRYINGKDLTRIMYETSHYQWVINTKGVDLVYNKFSLLKKINLYLENPQYKQKERKKMIKNLCYRVDGKSVDRILDSIMSYLNDDFIKEL